MFDCPAVPAAAAAHVADEAEPVLNQKIKFISFSKWQPNLNTLVLGGVLTDW